MRVAALSDVHGNLWALEAVLADAAGRGVDQSIDEDRQTDPDSNVFVSDFPFRASTNGWGPVERDMSNGEFGSGETSSSGLFAVVAAGVRESVQTGLAPGRGGDQARGR
jgi:hypothetical protein